MRRGRLHGDQEFSVSGFDVIVKAVNELIAELALR
jgi:hypothetical protein